MVGSAAPSRMNVGFRENCCRRWCVVPAMEAINDAHVSEPGLVVVDVATADDATAFAFHSALAVWWATTSVERTTRDAGQAGKAVLAWADQDALTARDLEQIALQLTGHARAVASDVRRRADQLPKDSGPRALADVVLREAEGRLSVAIEGTVRCVQNRARLVRALYERLDRLEAARSQAG
ncbi:DUF6207 family protein [Streptomyces werraensis]|uniref:DUF6207 family protein n=2 Tax=Streptomyces TaxID=1883 RepID=UPI0037F5E2F3